MTEKIPYNRPSVVGRELDYVKDCILKGHTAGDGSYTKKVSELLNRKLACSETLLTPSGTAALELAMIALEIGKGDEIIMPSFTFVSTANSVVLRGAKPVFAEIRPDTLNINENKIEELITDKTKAILVVHYAGVVCEMDKILEIAKKHSLRIIEDAAHALHSKYKGKAAGTFAELAAFSFHETKNFICGEGGALTIKDPEIAEKATIIREKGTNRTAFFRGTVDKYTWVDAGSSYLLSDILAAFLLGQLENAEKITNKREAIHNRYQTELKDLEEKELLRLPICPAECESNYHIFYVLLNDLDTREALRKHLAEKNIMAVFHYIPLHSAPFGKTLHDGRELAITDKVSDCILRLPVYPDLSNEEQTRVVEGVREFFA